MQFWTKRVLFFVVILMMSALLWGCGGSGGNNSTIPGDDAQKTGSVLEDFSYYIEKEAAYLTLTVANATDWRLTPYHILQEVEDPIEGIVFFVDTKEIIAKAGKTLQELRLANAKEMSDAINKLDNEAVKKAASDFRDKIMEDIEYKNKLYDKQLESCNVISSFMLSDAETVSDEVKEAVEVLNGMELEVNNAIETYKPARQELISQMEQQYTKEYVDNLSEENLFKAWLAVAQDFKDNMPELYEKFHFAFEVFEKGDQLK